MERNIPLLKELLKQWMTASCPVKINRVPFEEWMTTILSATKRDTLLQETGGCNKNCEIDKLSLKNRMPKIRLAKK